MANTYKLTVSGFELNATCHILTDEQARRVIDIQQADPNGTLSSTGYTIEQILEEFYLFQDNAWSISKPLINDSLSFRLVDHNGNLIETFSIKEITNRLDIDHNLKSEKHVILPNKSKQNLLLYYEENKGDVCAFEVATEVIPTASDFNFLKGKMQTPDGYFEYIANMWYNGEELKISYDDQDVAGKTSFMKVWVPD